MSLKKNQIMLLLFVYTSVILGTTVSSYVRRIQGIGDTDIQNIKIGMENPCVSFYCHNGGSCYSAENSPVCICINGYSGLHCDEKYDETSTDTQTVELETTTDISKYTATEDPCASYDCHDGGFCFIFEDNPTCICKTGYYGHYCEEKIDLCKSTPCQNEGMCIQEGSSFRCHCKLPYLGAFCEKDPCTENPCLNGGTCVQSEYSFKCQCSYPYSGDTCQYDACDDNPCFNGGTCEKDGDFFKCKCQYGYYGNVCEKVGYESTPDFTTEYEITSLSTAENYTEPGICSEDADCLNGGVCRNSHCECPPNFGGYWCERNFICEKLKPTCRAMGATCKIVGLNAICDCPQDKMYQPKSGMCEDICDPWKCKHGRCEIDGRTYKCDCDAGYTGHQCDETIQSKSEKSHVLSSVVISLLALLCLLLIGQMCLYFRNQKFKLATNDVVLPECTSSRLTTSDV